MAQPQKLLDVKWISLGLSIKDIRQRGSRVRFRFEYVSQHLYGALRVQSFQVELCDPAAPLYDFIQAQGERMFSAYLIVAIAHDDHYIVDILIFEQLFQHFQGAHVRTVYVVQKQNQWMFRRSQ